MTSQASSPEDSPSPPISQNLNCSGQTTNQATLTLISYAHSHPLVPEPDLKFDMRKLPNPPKNVRDAYNGTSSRLQEWLEHEPQFVAKRDSIRDAILETMKETTDKSDLTIEAGPGNEEDGYGDKSKDLGTDDFDESSEAETEELELRVGIFCAMGRHRSVAIVEQLSKMSWPGWNVEVQHRDLLQKRGQEGRTGAKKSRGTKSTWGGEMSSTFGDTYD